MAALVSSTFLLSDKVRPVVMETSHRATPEQPRNIKASNVASACTDLFIRTEVMPEDKGCELLRPPRSSEKKRRKKSKRKKTTASSSPPENTEKLQAVSLPPETLPLSPLPPQSPGQPRGQLPKPRATSRKDRQRLAGSGRRSTKHPKDSQILLTPTSKNSASGAPAQGYVAELSSQARESLRWEGELEDPQAEETRLELYRANRRQRYVKHREDRLKETQNALRQIFPIESREKKL